MNEKQWAETIKDFLSSLNLSKNIKIEPQYHNPFVVNY